MSNVHDKLDSLLRMYFNEGSTQGEKDNALSLFKKRCSKEGIDSDEYITRFKNGNTNQRTRSKSYTNNHDNCNYGFGFGNRAYRNNYRQNNTYKEQVNPDDHSKYVRNDHFYFKIKEVIAKVDIKNDKVVVFLSTLCKEQGSERWGLRNFVIYPKSTNAKYVKKHLVEKYFTQKNGKEFVIHTGKNKHFHDHLVIQKLWEIHNDGTESKIVF